MRQNSLLGGKGCRKSGYHRVIKFADFVYFSEIINRNIREISDNWKTTVYIDRWYCRYGMLKIMFVLQKTKESFMKLQLL